MLYVLRVLLFGIVFIIGLQKVTKVVFVFGEFKGEHVTEIVAQLIFISFYFKFKEENKKFF